jgi:hypothetical protein
LIRVQKTPVEAESQEIKSDYQKRIDDANDVDLFLNETYRDKYQTLSADTQQQNCIDMDVDVNCLQYN